MYIPESAGWLAALAVPAVLWVVMDRLEPDATGPNRTEPDPNPSDPPAPASLVPPVPPPSPRPRPMPVPPAEDTVDYPAGDGGRDGRVRPPSREGDGGRRRYGDGIISNFSTWVSALLWGDPDTGGGLFGRGKPR